MSELAQAALISGGIFALVMLRGYGRRALNVHALLMPLVSVGVFGWIYLRHAPLGSAGDWAAYAVAIAVGLVFGGVANAVTKVERDPSGKPFTITGPAFAAVWALAVVLRLGFVWSVQNWDWARNQFGEFMIVHHVSFEAIAPFFLLWALAMVLSRVVAVVVRARALPAPALADRVAVSA